MSEEQKKTGREPSGVLITRTIAMPGDTNPNGDVFGGWIMSQMDMARATLASEVAQGRTVTVSVEKIVFAVPVRIGQAVGIYGRLLRVGNSSMDIRLEVWARQLLGSYAPGRELVTEGVFRYVAIDQEGRPRRVPENPKYFSRH